MASKTLSKEWFDFAKRDLQSAKFLINMNPKPLEIICYHCEQSAEKYLKGYIILKGNKTGKTHDLIVLNNRCKAMDIKFERIEDDCIDLVPYGVQVRYPYQLEVNEEDMNNAITSAERIEQFIESIIR